MAEIEIAFNDRRVQYDTSGGEATLAYDFPIYEQGDLIVIETDDGGTDTVLVHGTDYTLTGVGAEAGGNVVLDTGVYPSGAPADYKYTVYSYVEEERISDYSFSGDFTSAEVNKDLDKQIMMLQQLRRDVLRAPLLDITDVLSALPIAVEPTADRQDRVLSFNAAGTGLEAGPTATEISNAQTYANNASTSATAAAASASAASTSETAAASSASAASTSATAAASSASSASTSASNAATSESNAAASESAAATSESNAATSESNAASSESNAATSASNASTSASNAATSETNAASSAAAAETSYDNFDDRYLGTKSSDPTLDNDGNALLTGAMYFNTSTNLMKVYNGSTWDNINALTPPDDSVTNTKLANMTEATFKMRAAGAGTGDPIDGTAAQALTALGLDGLILGVGGRLTLTTAVPVLTSDVTGATTIYYTPYLHDKFPIYDGTDFVMTTFTELLNSTTDNTKNPAAVVANKNYDFFLWDDDGTLRLGRGDAWTSDTVRSAGTALVRVNGILVNNTDITNGPAANRGTYVGTVRSNGSAQIDVKFGATPAAGGSAAVIGIWNMYNRVSFVGATYDNTDTWSYTTATIRALNNSNSNRVSMVRGLDEDVASANLIVAWASSSVNVGAISIGLDSTSAFHGASYVQATAVNGNAWVSTTETASMVGLGFHYFQAQEKGNTGWTFIGDNGGTAFQTGMRVMGRY